MPDLCRRIGKGIYKRGEMSDLAKTTATVISTTETFHSREQARAWRDGKRTAESLAPVSGSRSRNSNDSVFTLDQAPD